MASILEHKVCTLVTRFPGLISFVYNSVVDLKNHEKNVRFAECWRIDYSFFKL